MSEYETDPERRKLLDMLESDIDYKFRDLNILERALTHKSYVYETHAKPIHDNESLEFLGDAVLGFLSSAELFSRYPDLSEGKLSKIKAFLVSSSSLLKRSQALELGKYIRLGYGEEKSGGRQKRAIQVDAYEALVAAIFLDGGIGQAEVFVRREFFSVAPMFNLEEVTYTDYKSTLQERLHLLRLPEPRYRTVDELGPDHRKTFVVEVSIQGAVLSRAEGRTKKEAQQEVARLALEGLKDRVLPPAEVEEMDGRRHAGATHQSNGAATRAKANAMAGVLKKKAGPRRPVWTINGARGFPDASSLSVQPLERRRSRRRHTRRIRRYLRRTLR